jgi:hypothetical protein
MAGLLKPGMALANWNKAGFEAKDLNGALSADWWWWSRRQR